MGEDGAKLLHAASFGAAAEAYDRGRPAYPEAALDWLLPAGGRPLRVLDLGAGTGKLTRQLAGRGLDVVAVDPSPGMLDQLRRASPGIPALVGSAEAIPLDAGSVDLVVVAQAWHWMDPVRAVPEVARVLKPGGRLGLLWNCREPRQNGWTADLARLMGRLGWMEDNSDDPPVGPPFGALARHDVAWSQPVTAEGLLDLVASRSYVIVLPPDERARVLDAVRAIAADEPGFAAGGQVPMPYITRCSRADLA